jgi:RHS repeat-associated protein
VDGVTTSYAYDGAGQLLSEVRPGYSASYTYDGNGNRLTRAVNGVTEVYAYDAGDKLLSVSVGGVVVRSFGYDAAGRTTSVVSSAGTTTIAYDYRGRATSIVGPGVAQTNVFNGLDTRVGSTTNSVSRTFLRDGAYVTDPVLADGAAVYTPGVSERRGGVTTFLHSGIKNAEAQTSTAQTLTATRTYDAFGNVVSSTGTWQGPFGYGGPFGYQEDATGLRLLGHRLYDPSTGRFLTRDPIKDGRHWYVYSGNDPVNFADPDGLTPKALVAIPVALAIWDLVDAIRDPSPENLLGLLPGPQKLPKWLARAEKIVDGLRGIIGGRRGGAPHREAVAQAEAEIKAARPDWRHTAGGSKPERIHNNRYPDLTFEDPTGQKHMFQIGDVLRTRPDCPVSRERRAIADLALPDQHGRIANVTFIPKGCRWLAP